jgi:hypothetical protein
MEDEMRGMLFWIIVAAMLSFSSLSLALDGGFDCAEGSDEDLAAEEPTVNPATLTAIPIF